MNLPEDYIPIEDKINEFKAYLGSTDRAIISARFGDGKSTFLKEFSEKSKDEYILFTINPLHYQVADNKDIFEYIKRDVLLQILSYAEFNEVSFSNSLIAYYYIYNNKLSILHDLFDSMPNIDLKVVSTSLVTNPFRNLIKNIINIKKYKEKIDNSTDAKKTEKFISAFDNYKGSMYEFDEITQLICSINQMVKKTYSGKDIILVIEDLDRIDPAHIFRILNILSAQIERHQPGLLEFEMTQGKNKFLFDKILLVCDFENIQSIFHHFYGAKTDFKGYISKFSSRKPYFYSLKDEYKNLITRRFDNDLMEFPRVMSLVADMIIEHVIEPDTQNEDKKKDPQMEKARLRHIHDLLDKNLGGVKNEPILIDEWSISSHNNLSKLLYILSDFSININLFFSAICNEKLITEFHELIGICWFIPVNENFALKYSLNDSTVRTVGELHDQQYVDSDAKAITDDDNNVIKIVSSIKITSILIKNRHQIINYVNDFVICGDRKKLKPPRAKTNFKF